ncbi:unnamed protein product [Adineta ricciae]|uniref:PDZ domain-containing protein n=1 Tax=Adineta ricciae TaxID=249248 RepID=A0A814UXU6_ADIRI|nr:unnamed protein product [Adineta ricciae]CAF1213530.1 unnamed protein product [Adineta ricciae]
MKVIVNFGEKKVVVPCGPSGDLSIRELIRSATAKYSKLSSYNNVVNINSEQIQLRLNNGAVVDPDDRVCDVADDREELFAIVETHSTVLNSNGELSSSLTSSNLSTSLSDHEPQRPGVPPPLPNSSSIHNRHEVIVTDADLRTRSLRIKTESNNTNQSNVMNINRSNHSSLMHASDNKGMYNVHTDETTADKIFYISLPKENSPLGIHVIPYNTDEEHVNGLLLQNIEPDGRIKRQGILEINDRIVEINRVNIEQCSFEKAQLIFRNALLEPELELKVIRTKPLSTSFYLNNNNEINQNTKRLGKIIKIALRKGTDGLGFKLASRDNPTGIANPIYVKTIFPKGAAIEDGRLRNGDRLLTVNSIDVTQMSLQDAVGLLRETRIGETVHLCISRQNDGSLPKDLMSDDVKTQLMTFDIPLRDTSSAGLGITLKGKTSIIDGQSIDLGIFVKSILTGGAAYRDNRLCPNDQILIINDSSLVNLSNLEAAAILHDAVRKEIHPGFIKITISRVLNDGQERNSRYVKETELLPPVATTMNDENELDLTNFVPPVNQKPPMKPTKPIDPENRSTMNQSPIRTKTTLSEKQNQEEIANGNTNPFERETPFRQSISEKRRLTQQPNSQVVQWKQRSFHDARTNSERRQPPRPLPDSSARLPRSSSYESIHRPIEDEEHKRQSKLRNRACNDSFRHAVDKSYCQNGQDESTNGEKPNKGERQKFKFSNLFTTKAKRKENQEEQSPSNQTTKTVLVHSQSAHENQAPFYPPPPAPFSSRPSSSKSQNNERPSTGFVHPSSIQPQGYQPYRFDSTHASRSTPVMDHSTPPRHEAQIITGKSSLSINLQKPTHPPIPRQFLQSNINGTQSLKHHQNKSRSPYPPTFSTPTDQFPMRSQAIDFPINASQSSRPPGYPPRARVHLQFENPANV